MANCFIKGCRKIEHFPTRVLCLLVLFLQTGIVNYYLVQHKSSTWLAFLAGDIVVVCLFVSSFVTSYQHLTKDQNDKTFQKGSGWIGVLAWFVYSVLTAVKAGIIFADIADELDEVNFFGPNTLKTTLALSGVVFLLFLSSLHDAKPGSPRRSYIEELTGTVIFDIMDCVDSMEPLFIREDRDAFPPGLVEAIITIACINFVLPTIPLLTLTNTKFGHAKLPRRLVMLHKLCLAFAINLPLLVMRMILWHGLNHGVSIFSLKNIIVIAMISFDFYEHHEAVEGESDKTDGKAMDLKEKEREKEAEAMEKENKSYALEDRFNYSADL